MSDPVVRPLPVPEELRRELVELGRKFSALAAPKDPVELVPDFKESTQFVLKLWGRERPPTSRSKTILRRLKPLVWIPLFGALGAAGVFVVPGMAPTELITGGAFTAGAVAELSARRRLAPIVGFLEDRFAQSEEHFQDRQRLLEDLQAKGRELQSAARSGDRPQITGALDAVTRSASNFRRRVENNALDRVPKPDTTRSRLGRTGHRVAALMRHGLVAGRTAAMMGLGMVGVVLTATGIAPVGWTAFGPIATGAWVYNVGRIGRAALNKHDAVVYTEFVQQALSRSDDEIQNTVELTNTLVSSATQVVRQIEQSAVRSPVPEITPSLDTPRSSSQIEPDKSRAADPTDRNLGGGPVVGF